MRRSRQDAAVTRERIVEAASHEFRLNGIAEGLEDIMKTAGLTHGGFYRHFESKSQLISEAVALAFDQLLEGLETAIDGKAAKTALASIVQQYLSPAMRDHVESACPLYAIGTELRRAGRETSEIVSKGTQRLISLIASQFPRLSPRQATTRAYGIAAAMVGGIVLSRLARDKNLADSILRDTREFILASSGGS
jgi:TetR/AcrR family transcriptional repressor of nem operon